LGLLKQLAHLASTKEKLEAGHRDCSGSDFESLRTTVNLD
jgi:hypothetical protein